MIGHTGPRVDIRVLVACAALLAAGPTPRAQGDETRIAVAVGRSVIVETMWDVTRIAVTDPAIADALVVQPREILIDGKSAGTISLILWGRGGERAHYAVVVVEPAAPGTIAVAPSQVRPDDGPRQVMLQVRFGEVRHDALTEAGLALFTGGSGPGNVAGRTTTQQFTAPVIGLNDDGAHSVTFGDLLNVFVFSGDRNIGLLLKALQMRGVFHTLAEPTLLAFDGQEASFLAGGEIPVPVVQGLTNSVSVQYKEYGIRLTFTPTITGDVVHLKVRPEVSQLDFVNGVTIAGFRIPALSTRRAETQIALRSGQSFAIAGLLDNASQLVREKVPGLGDLPIIGRLFQSKSDRRERTELVVIITPTLVRPLDAGAVPSPALPVDPARFLEPE